MPRLHILFGLLWLLGISSQVKAEYQLDLGAGIFAIQLPHYPGAEQDKSYLLPMPYVYYESDEFELERNQLTGFMWSKGKWHLDLSAGAGIAVNSDDNRARISMPDLDWVFELGPSIKYYVIGTPKADQQWFAELFARKALGTDFGSVTNVGWRYGPSMTYQKQFWQNGRDRFELTARVNVNFSDYRYLNYYYGVQQQYATAQRSEFDNGSGYAGSDLSLGLTYKTAALWTGGYLRYHQLSGSNQSDSPLVFERQSWAVGFGIVWIFYSKKGK